MENQYTATESWTNEQRETEDSTVDSVKACGKGFNFDEVPLLVHYFHHAADRGNIFIRATERTQTVGAMCGARSATKT